ncbi:MAG: hypothetical protein LH475_06750 [Cryobacterium sp.]|uniref:hypothetical protein n=1 Tax=Cryobacterium sp. TaxID=1926290 RepID=UPI00228D1296|nr:hypothetical protein [Cryobacterium sp.]MCY7404308.1 hypothetical protein [Cryobacterium sp.]
MGKAQLEHSWSYLPDIVTTLIAAADHTGDWGRIWHVPSATVSRTDIAAQLNLHFGIRGKVSGYPQWLLHAFGVANPMMHEVWASSYQFMVPYVIDSTETESVLGVAASPWNEALLATAESYRSRK